MKKLFFLICILLFNQNYVFSHGQGVHQHLVRESYKLLKYYVGQDIRIMKDHVGYNETGSGVYNPGGLLVIGAHREDEEDARYEENGPLDFNVTMTHFWDLDYGDNSTFDFLGVSYLNAYQKALSYYYGTFVMFIPASNPSAIDRKLHVTTVLGDKLIIYPDEPQYGGFYLSYNSLVDLYKTCKLRTQLIGKNQMWNVTKQRWEYWSGEVYISTELRDRLVWELLGRICHLFPPAVENLFSTEFLRY